ncbi:MAG: PD40 domain-containing protein [Bacteroidales bacterium]|nr:PD40 domain-containing protein [Bacteroidales bacterium]
MPRIYVTKRFQRYARTGITCLLLLVSCVAMAQNRDVNNLVFSGDNAVKQKNFYGAVKLYEEALKQDGKMYDVVWKTAEAYRMDNDYANALVHYKTLVDKAEYKYPNATYHYAQMLKSNEDFMRAQYFFKRFITLSKKDGFKGDKTYAEQAEQEILNCEYAWKQQNHPQAVEIKHADDGMNSVYSDFGASLSDGKVLFSSIRPESDSVKTYTSKIYSTEVDNFANVASIDIDVLSPADISNPYISNDGKKMYFSITDDFANGNTYIYMCTRNGDGWSEPQKLPDKINTPGYNSTQPYLVEYGSRPDILLWSSNRPGGEGGYDIYSCEILPDGSFGSVKNIGRPIIEDERFAEFTDTTSMINTPGDEITPFYNLIDSTLYFSSNHYQTIGAFDIFAVKGNFRVWNEIQNLGYPINSAQNDIYYKIYPEEGIAFLTSNRKGALAQTHQSCCNDIFYYNIEKFVSEEERLAMETKIRIATLTQRTKLLVPISLYFHNDIPNPNSWDTVTTQNYSDTYFSYMQMQEKYRREFSKGLDRTRREQATDSIDVFFSNMVEENYNRLIEFTKMMKELLESGQKVAITIKGFTSPLNTVEYNNNLAKRRISSLVNYFNEYENGVLRQYIENGQIEYKFVAFGKTMAAANVSDDRSDQRNSVYNPAAARERRIEIIAVEIER